MTALDESFAFTVSLPVISCSTSTSLLFSRVRNPFLTHALDTELTTTNIPSLDDAVAHTNANKDSSIHTPDGFVHFTFDDEEWCNLSNEHDPISYKDIFSRPDALQWQTTYEDEMKSLHDHKVWDLIPHDQVPTG